MAYLWMYWELKPFVEIRIEENGCEIGWDPVFSKEWSGIEYQCLEMLQKSGRCVSSIGPIPLIQMTQLEGVTICGRRGGEPFLNTQRPSSDGLCPGKTVPCSRATSPENTICVEQKESECGIADNCPITEIRLVA